VYGSCVPVNPVRRISVTKWNSVPVLALYNVLADYAVYIYIYIYKCDVAQFLPRRSLVYTHETVFTVRKLRP
jgi:hypothetical protein